MASVENLYKWYAILDDAGSKAGQHEDIYNQMLQGVKGSSGARKLSAGFITKFYPSFPDLSEKAIEALIDLCEDEDVSIRKLAIQHMPNLHREDGDNSPLSDILSQLLTAEDETEVQAVKRSLEILLKKDSRGALAGLFFQVNNNDEACREKSLRFLSENVVALAPSLFKGKDAVERYTLDEIKKAFPTVAGDEFPHFMKLLSCLSIVATTEGAQEVVDAVASLACLHEPFQASDSDAIDRLIVCTRSAMPSIRRGAASLQFTEYFVNNAAFFADVASDESRATLYKWLASLCCSPPPADDSLALVATLLETLMEYLPEPPSAADGDESSVVKATARPVDFVAIECLLYSLHQLSKQCPEYFTGGDASGQSRLVHLRQRLQVVGVKSMSEQRTLKSSLAGKTAAVVRKDSTLQSRQESLVACQSISAVIKVFFKNPPVYKNDLLPASITKESVVSPLSPASAGKRPTPSDDDAQQPAAKRSTVHVPRSTYQPPVGKFSRVAAPAKTPVKSTAAQRGKSSNFSAFTEPSNPLMRGENVATAAPAVAAGGGRGRGRGRGRGSLAATQSQPARNTPVASRPWKAAAWQQQQQSPARQKGKWKRTGAAAGVTSPTAAQGNGRRKLVRNSNTVAWRSPKKVFTAAKKNVAGITSPSRRSKQVGADRSFPDVAPHANRQANARVLYTRGRGKLSAQQSRGRGGRSAAPGRAAASNAGDRSVTLSAAVGASGKQRKRWQQKSF